MGPERDVAGVLYLFLSVVFARPLILIFVGRTLSHSDLTFYSIIIRLETPYYQFSRLRFYFINPPMNDKDTSLIFSCVINQSPCGSSHLRICCMSSSVCFLFSTLLLYLRVSESPLFSKVFSRQVSAFFLFGIFEVFSSIEVYFLFDRP